MLRTGRGLFRRGFNQGNQFTITYSALPIDRLNHFHPCVTIRKGAEEHTLILKQVVKGWMPALIIAERVAQKLEAHGRANPKP